MSTVASISTGQRIRGALIGAVAVGLGMPVVLSLWTPRAVAIGWTVSYLACLFVFVAARMRSDNPRVELVWTTIAALYFAFVPVSTIVYDGTEFAIWAAGAVTAFHMTNEVATRRFIHEGDWRVGLVITAIAITVSAAVQVGPVLGAAVGIACLMIILNATEVRTATDAIRHERAHDDLTGLLNRRGLFDAIADLPDGEMTIVMIDADRFKTVNDAYGYAVGDALLNAVAEALQERLGEPWQLARQGGDEFAAVAPGRPGVPDSVADPVTAQVAYRDSHIEIALDLSAGVAHSTGEKRDPERIMSRAIFALRASKRNAGGLARFDSGLEQRFTHALEVGATQTLPGTEALFAVAQPITDGETTHGWELLARWRSGDGAVMLPSRFLPLLAENGLMPELNDTMLAIGVRFAARFNNRPTAPFVSVNITASHLANPRLVEHVASLLEEHRVHPGRLMIEITESEGLGALATWRAAARGLVDLGIKLAIDDFGSGYSSIERMNQLPITHLKFDRSFATSLTGAFGEVVHGVVRFAEATGLGVIAEGIETLDEYESMRAIGVRLYQGHRFAKPMSLNEAERQLIADNSTVAIDLVT